jgi:DNA-binding NarL/FixJ family response regulator
MTVPNEPAVLLIDALPLRSLGFISALDRLNNLGDPTKAQVTLHAPDGATPWIDAHANCEMLIYIAGGAYNADCDNLERIKALRVLAPDMPLMILSDRESREEIISTLNVGAQGLLYVGANAELALRALSFVLNGGSNFPSAMRPKHTYPASGDRVHPRPVLCHEQGQRRCKKFGRRSEKWQSNSEAEGGPRTPEPRRYEWGQRRCKKFGRRSEKSQSNSEAAGGPRTPESRRHEQGYCAPAGDDGGYG